MTSSYGYCDIIVVISLQGIQNYRSWIELNNDYVIVINFYQDDFFTLK